MSELADPTRENVHHFLVAFVGQTDAPVSNAAIADSVGKAFQLNGVVPMYGATYNMQYQIDPRSVGLPEAWHALDEKTRNEFEVQFPRLAIAITMLVPPPAPREEPPGV